MIRYYFVSGQYLDVQQTMKNATDSLQRAGKGGYVIYNEGIISVDHVTHLIEVG